ncbi:LuxR C-terminal-related transcriptional regulator [Paenibacillus lentus]|uniref:LuxR family transcriptional regulator n=1 Tax=Paenibacillus lentus TaxID=1338368 RepID=A0A3Q8S6X9_9BACL|nr:LuxR C-terminal-related transcriptional regulator [Paenibacillus lentus]AZK48755.1 LuxR family transcriptional regulator [Paenibacillus lentus]
MSEKKDAFHQPSSNSAAVFTTQSQFEQIVQNNKQLITIFQECIDNIKEHLSGTYLFFLTDEDGVLLAMDYCQELQEVVRKSEIRLGMYLTEESCGVNAVSEAMAHRTPIYLPPEEHESPFFKNWHCFSTPLTVGSKTIGYLDVSTINANMKSELIAIAKLIPGNMLSSLQNLSEAPPLDPVPLTERQLHVLRLIAQGQTVKSIALKLNIKECTVNHHKKIIFEKLGVQSSTEAVSVASRMSYL